MWKGRSIVSCVAVLFCAATLMADPVSDFLKRYELFVNGVAALDSKTTEPETMDSLKLVYKNMTKEYKSCKKQMTQIQLEKYYNLKAKYQKSIAVFHTKRGTSAVGRWVKSVVRKKKD